MRMLINDEEDDEDDGDDDGDDGDDGDDDDDDDGGDDDGDDDDDEEEEDEDEEGEDEDDHEDDDPLPAGNLVSGGTRGESNLGLPGKGGSNWKVSGFPMVLLPAYSLLKQEQLQLAQLALVTIEGKKT